MARLQGEEVSSRLLFPMIVLFGLVLALLMIPAVLNFYPRRAGGGAQRG